MREYTEKWFSFKKSGTIKSSSLFEASRVVTRELNYVCSPFWLAAVIFKSLYFVIEIREKP